jgi:hypothetical protein
MTPAILLAVLSFASAFGFDQLFNFFDGGGAQLIERFEPAFGLRFRRQASGVGSAASSTVGGGGSIEPTQSTIGGGGPIESTEPATVATSTGTTTDVPPPTSTTAGCAAGFVSFDGTLPCPYTSPEPT